MHPGEGVHPGEREITPAEQGVPPTLVGFKGRVRILQGREGTYRGERAYPGEGTYPGEGIIYRQIADLATQH